MKLCPNPEIQAIAAALKARPNPTAQAGVTQTRHTDASGDRSIDVLGEREAVLQHAAHLLQTEPWHLFEECTTHDGRYVVRMLRMDAALAATAALAAAAAHDHASSLTTERTEEGA